MTDTLSVVREKAAKYHIPASVLWGVYGVETSHGSNVSTSSAGAMGAFQFIRPTAKSYNYPYTNTQTASIFSGQAESAAHYLSDLYREHGTWEGALRAYSGGGYGWSQVASQAQQSGGSSLGGGQKYEKASTPEKVLKDLNPFNTEVFEAAGEKAKKIASPLEAFGKVGSTLADWIENPLTPIKFLGGSVLVYVGVRTLTAGTGAARESRHGVGYALETVATATAAGRVARRAKVAKPKPKAG